MRTPRGAWGVDWGVNKVYSIVLGRMWEPTFDARMCGIPMGPMMESKSFTRCYILLLGCSSWTPYIVGSNIKVMETSTLGMVTNGDTSLKSHNTTRISTN
jgi:hypothetical protein